MSGSRCMSLAVIALGYRCCDLGRHDIACSRYPVLGEVTTTLTSMADGADLLLTGLIFEQPAANVAEYYDIPLATLHFFPMRAHGQLLPFLPPPFSRTAGSASI
jgi:hypothetical protein